MFSSVGKPYEHMFESETSESKNYEGLRPIALCNVNYKILAKVLANRLKKLLPWIISYEQATFFSGRSITDNVLVAFEIIHHMKRKNKGK